MNDEQRSRTDALRAFIAVDLDAASRAVVADLLARLRDGSGRGVRWVQPGALHVTLFFLGNVALAQVGPIARSVAGEVAFMAPFALELGEVHLFPSSRRARVVALGVAPEKLLSELARAVQRGVAEQGFEPEGRPFRAHLTLGRIKSGPPPATRGLTAPKDTTCRVSEVVLFRSDLHREGAKYTPLERMALGGAVVSPL